VIDAQRLQKLVDDACLPVRVVWLASIGSTNEECERLAHDGAAEGLAVVADAQTEGRGRFDRAWVSPEGNLYLSILVRPAGPAAGGPQGLVASLAVLDTIEEVLAPSAVRHPVALKWPNDVVCGGRKLCGILSTAGTDARGGAYVAVGIGVNLNAAPQGLGEVAATLASIAGRPIDVTPFAAGVIKGFMARYRRLAGEGFAPQFGEWERRSGWIGNAVTVDTGGGRVLAGTAVGLGPAGALRVRLVGGAVEEVHAADATLATKS
jgi:BirA family transcriptional regulator, biotin operon repressor / biotin---[acetyl-CoA-carboxylase] ligase